MRQTNRKLNVVLPRTYIKNFVRVEGLEPPCLAAPDPKSGTSANFATPASFLPVLLKGLAFFGTAKVVDFT